MSGLAPIQAPRRALLCGYYGEHNLGDDALLKVLSQQLPEGWKPVITARDSAAVQTLVPQGSTVNRRSLKAVLRSIRKVDVVVFGGGSLLQDSTSFGSLLYYILVIVVAKINGKPVLLWGQGLGPLHQAWSRLMVRQALSWTTSISWRDPASLELAERLKVRTSMSVAPDPVWSHPVPPYQGGGTIVLCWRPTHLLSDPGWKHLLEAVDQLSEITGTSITWLAFHTVQDVGLLPTLKKKGLVSKRLSAKSQTITVTTINQAQEIFRKSSLVIAMRLHALILAIIGRCPTAGLSYDPKVEAAAKTAEIPWIDLRQLPSIGQLLEQWRMCMSAPPSISRIHQVRNESLKHESILQDELRKLDRNNGYNRVNMQT